MTVTDELLGQMVSVVGDDNVLTGEAVTSRVVGIWDDRPVAAKAIVRPSSTEQLSACMKACADRKQTVVIHGGLTGLVQGALSSSDDLVISLERMTRIESVNVAQRCLVAQAGVPLQKAQDAAADAGLMLPLDLGARGSCTLGGNVATNAGGNRVIRFGMTRDLVLGLEAVLPDGTVLSSMNRMLKNNAGFDLKQLFVGTEGTLGVVTKVVLRLVPQLESESTALVACDSFASVCKLLDMLDRELGGRLSAFECMWQDFYRQVSQHASAQAPLSSEYPFYVLLEALGADGVQDEERFLAVLSAAQEQGLIVDSVLAKSQTERDAFWLLRDNVESCLQFGPGFIFDVSLPIADMETYVETVLAGLDQAFTGHHSFVFGHVGDGNLHFVVSAGDEAARDAVEQCVYEPLRSVGGSVSAEHGIGLEKKHWLPVSRNEAEIALMRRLKAAMDPDNLLNPGKVI